MTHQQAVDRHAVERYLLDEMPEIERYAFEEHLFDCEMCADDVRIGAVMREGVEAGFLPVDWCITILRSSERWLTLTIEMQNRMATRLFPSRSADAIVGFLQHVGRELGSNP